MPKSCRITAGPLLLLALFSCQSGLGVHQLTTSPNPSPSSTLLTPTVFASTNLTSPTKLAVDSAGDIYVVDSGNNVVSAGVVVLFNSNGSYSQTLASGLNSPNGVCLDLLGNWYYSLGGSVGALYEASTWLVNYANLQGLAYGNGPIYAASNGSTANYVLEFTDPTSWGLGTAWGMGPSGFSEGNSVYQAHFNNPVDVAFDASNNILYVADKGNNAIRKLVVSSSTVTTIAGGGGVQANPGPGVGTAGGSGEHDDIGTSALFSGPSGLALDPAGTTLYVADTGNNAIRKVILATGQVTTLAKGVPLNGPQGLALASDGTLFIANTGGANILKVTP